ncbi:MAG: phage holin family protein [Candidatus Uhrbacteria bacterium]|nr:phage holin family protein [Candidatus Uhrbacteria bacterium]
MSLILRWLINAVALLALTQILSGFEVSSFYIALIAALIIGLLNAVIRPLLIVLTLPINVLTLGLFTFVINALIIWFVSTFVSGFAIAGFWVALLAAIILWAVGVLTSWFIRATKNT